MFSTSSFLKITILAVLAFIMNPDAYGQKKPMSVLSSGRGWIEYSDLSNSMYHQISCMAYERLDKRKSEIDKLNSKKEWQRYQKDIFNSLFEGMDKLPKNTPLNARVTGKIDKDSYTVEKIVYESQPEFYVTAAMFIPKKREEKTPAIIYCSGHSDLAFRSPVYQNVILNLVDKGFIVFAFDPVGQGERFQYFNPETGKSDIGGPTKEHSYVGAQCLLSGTTLINYMIMDGVRAVDYLLTRPEVDPDRIGITGRSGGGTQSAFIAAYDKRIYAAAPECYITSFKRIFESIGPQDAEQNSIRFIEKGFDHADLLHVRAPRPMLMVTTTNDFFSQQGARETFKEVGRTYRIMGKEDNLSMVEDYGVHESTRKNREAVCRFFQKHLNMPGDYHEVEVEIFDKEELYVTETGQVATSLGGKSVFDLNREYSEGKLKAYSPDAGSVDKNRNSLVKEIKEISGYSDDSEILSTVFAGKDKREGYSVEKYFIQAEDRVYPLPFYLSKPDKIENGELRIENGGKLPLIIYLDEKGKNEGIDSAGVAEQFVKRGYAVLSPDLFGTGELANQKFRGDSYIRGVSYNIWFGANLVGKSITGIRAEDIGLIIKSALSLKGVDPDNITVIANGGMSNAVLHYAATGGTVNNIVLVEPLLSYGDIAMTRYYMQWMLPSVVPGSAGVYDVDLLGALIAPRRLSVINPVTPVGSYASPEASEDKLSLVKEMYDRKGSGEMFHLLVGKEREITDIVSEFAR